MPALTMKLANELLDKAIAERGADYVYNPPEEMASQGQCYYVHGDQPGCIVGHVLNLFGVSLETLSTVEGNDAFYAIRKLLPSTSEVVREFLTDIQHNQDNGMRWGEAVNEARAEFGMAV